MGENHANRHQYQQQKRMSRRYGEDQPPTTTARGDDFYFINASGHDSNGSTPEIVLSTAAAPTSSEPAIGSPGAAHTNCSSPSTTSYPTASSSSSLSCSEVFFDEVTQFKWKLLPLVCLLPFGTYYTHDFPGSIGTGPWNTIEARFVDIGLDYSHVMNQALYAVYSYPSIILSVVAGLLVDRYLGLRRTMLLLLCMSALGSILFHVGVSYRNYPLMVISRILVGSGGESLIVTKGTFIARWFTKGRGLAFAYAITISFSRIGTSVSFLFSPMIADSYGVTSATLVGAVSCVVSLLSGALLVWADIYGTRKGLVPPERLSNMGGFKLRDLTKIPKEIWVMCMVAFFMYSSCIPFLGIAKNLFEVKYGCSEREAGKWVSLYQFASAGGSPLVGLVVDATGRYPLFLIGSSAMFFLIHVAIIMTNIPPYISTTLMGISYSIFVSGMWPSIPFIADTQIIGFSYAILHSFLNGALGTVPLIAGRILDAHTPERVNSAVMTAGHADGGRPTGGTATSAMVMETVRPSVEGFHVCLLFFALTAVAAGLAAYYLIEVDRANGGVLMADPAKARELRAKEEKQDSIE